MSNTSRCIYGHAKSPEECSCKMCQNNISSILSQIKNEIDIKSTDGPDYDSTMKTAASAKASGPKPKPAEHAKTPVINQAKFDNIRCIYEGIADNIGIEYQHVIEVIPCRQQRNAEQHELLNQYVRQCNKSEMKLEFSGLLQHLRLNGLYKYKKPKMKILGKIFDFYMAHNEYR